MTSRSILARQIADAWKATVEEHYSHGKINSESGLQAVIFSTLMKRFEEDGIENRKIFVTPSIKLPSSTIRPDLLVCNAKEIVSIIELKYAPRAVVNTNKDMASMSAIAGTPNISIGTKRYRGATLNLKEFSISKSALFVWAGIHSGTSTESDEWKKRIYDDHYFLELHALTRHGIAPKLVCNTNAYRQVKTTEVSNPT